MGRRGGGRGGDRASRFEGFVRSMDANGNGVLEPGEIPEERRGMFRFLAGRMGFDPEQPVAIDRIREAMTRRSTSEEGGGRPGESKEASTNKSTDKPLVPGFGVEQELARIPTFGERVNTSTAGTSSGGSSSKDSSSPSSASNSDRESRTRRSGEFTRPDGSDGGPSGPGESGESRSAESSGRKSYRFLTSTELLPGGLPDWFARQDANGDGQVSMAEYTSSWSDSKAREFDRYDLNGDGVITPRECLDAQAGAALVAGPVAGPPAGPGGVPPGGPGVVPPGGPGGGPPGAPKDQGESKPWWMP